MSCVPFEYVFYHNFSFSESLDEDGDFDFDLVESCCSCSSCPSFSAFSETEFVVVVLEEEDGSTRVRDESMERLVVVILGWLFLSFFILRAGRGSLYLVKL